MDIKEGDQLLVTVDLVKEMNTRQEPAAFRLYGWMDGDSYIMVWRVVGDHLELSCHKAGEILGTIMELVPRSIVEGMRQAWIDAQQKPAPEPVTYRYGMMNRPAHYAAPDGWIDAGKHPDFPNYGTVNYSRPLTPDELYRYEMRLIYPLPAMPVYPVGGTVRDVKTGKIHEVEHDGIEHWIGGDPMPIGGDWRDVAKWYRFALV